MRRKDRVQNFQASAGGLLGTNLLPSVHLLLQASLYDRTGQVFRTVDNHYSIHAPGALLLAYQALDAWTNGTLVLRTFGVFEQPDRDKILAMANEPLEDKIKQLLPNDSRLDDLSLLTAVRNELAHFSPRHYAQEDWHQQLSERGLIIPGLMSLPFDYYALAYWSVAVTNDIGERLAVGLEQAGLPGGECKENFVIPAQIVAPQSLGAFDQDRGLTLTPTRST